MSGERQQLEHEKIITALREIGKHTKFSEMDQESLDNVDSVHGHDYFISVARAATKFEPVEITTLEKMLNTPSGKFISDPVPGGIGSKEWLAAQEYLQLNERLSNARKRFCGQISGHPGMLPHICMCCETEFEKVEWGIGWILRCPKCHRGECPYFDINETIEVIKPSIDFTKIPNELNGRWVVIRKADQKLLGSGINIKEAIESSGMNRLDETIVVAKVQGEQK